MFFYKHYTPGLAINSFIIADLKTRKCAIIDPTRDVHEYVAIIEKENLSLVAILETHVHADFISGALELKNNFSEKPKIYCSGMGGEEWTPKYADVVVSNGDELSLGEIRFKVVHTPGHTPEHIMWALYDDTRSSDVPWILFTGDFLFVGAVGRPDLLGKKEFELLSHQLYRSVFKTLADFEAYTEIYPSHGAGSMCGKSLASRSSSTVGYEKHFNESLQYLPETEWVENLMRDMPPSPPYFSRMKSVNVEGAPVIGDKFKSLKQLTPQELQEFSLEGATILDIRSKESFSSSHIPGSINIPFSVNIATWAGWKLKYDVPIILVTEEKMHLEEVVLNLLRVGFDTIEGCLEGGISSWEKEGLATNHITTYSVQDLAKLLKEKASLRLIDIRQDDEWASGHIPTAEHIPLENIEKRIDELNKDDHIVVICGSGYRASIAASILKKSGRSHVSNVLGGMTAWQKESFPVDR
ncbi:MAG: MBL fold metallo-hydrolase [Chlamydiota bacterium]|nr:MBL fold metallo-hydrolase [Chlamydiota bacterium]